MHQFCLTPSLGIMDRSIIGCRIELKPSGKGPGRRGQGKKRRKSARPLLSAKRQSSPNSRRLYLKNIRTILGMVNNGPEEPVFFLKTALILDDRPGPASYFQKVETKR